MTEQCRNIGTVAQRPAPLRRALNGAAGFVAGASTIHDQFLVRRNQSRVGGRLFGRNPLRSLDNFGVRQQVQWLADVQDYNIVICCHELVELFRRNAEPLKLAARLNPSKPYHR